ncbi:sulfonate transport system substrate-binding protein [Azospirillum baldaniorum]|uniref:ABC transporter substrate-binding protein n=1 Tax=Azospirillum baldaniorum TaxID=1064539 RepID=UPI0011AD9421|nr:ABC transporter substrate-binding protein [Azospirillum baldaniorum]TWA57337.1 sulfonate transport system substrate-binding protein [Azospirillum baldaniorum]
MRRLMRTVSSIRGLILGLALGVGMCTATAAQPLTIRIGTPDQSVGPTPSGGVGITTFLDVRQLLQKEFEKDGITVQWTFFKGAGPAVNEAFANKQLDFAYLGDLAAIIGRANGLQTRFLVPLRGTNSFLAVAPDSGIGKLEDLKGKRLTVFKGTAYQLSLGRALARAGLTERDLQVVNLDWNAALAALAAKQLDANWAGVSLLTLQDKGLAKILLSSRDLGREYTIQSGFVGTDAFITAHPELTQRLINVLVRTQAWVSEPGNLSEFLGVTTERSGVPLALARAEYEGDDPKFRFSPLSDEFLVTNYQSSVDRAKEQGLIRKTYDVREWIDSSFVDKAVADLKLDGFWPRYDKEGKPLPAKPVTQ